MNSTTREYAPLKLTWKIPFGKYSGSTVKYLIDNDQSYFDWMHKNKVVSFDENVLLYRRSSLDQRKRFEEITVEKAKSRAMELSQWQVIRLKPEDRNLDPEAKWFKEPEEYMTEEILIPYRKTLRFDL